MGTRERRSAYAGIWILALVFGWIEASVAVYLREVWVRDASLGATSQLPSLQITMVALPGPLVALEMAREACTIALLAAVGWLAGRRPADRIGAFFLSFGIWDLAYYAVLRGVLGWPDSWSTWDVLFLIPVPWVAPVWAPVIVATLFVVAGSYLFWTPERERGYRWTDGGALVVSALLIVAAFLVESKAAIDHRVPEHFPVWLFWSGLALGAGWFLRVERARVRKSEAPGRSQPDEARREWLGDPLINKGTAYRRDERSRLHLEGLLPPRVESLEEQAARVIENVRAKTGPLERYRYLSAVQGDNETLFYRVVLDHLEETLPVVYTPTVGQACLEWSRIYERPRGLYISAVQHRGRVKEVLRDWPRDRVGIIVVTDGGRILGLGDLGANGMGIPIGKLSLYTACAGVPPELCLPVMLDVGTDNEPLRRDPLYLGERSGRMTGEPYDTLLEEFVAATQDVFPGVILQFEDFNNASAFRLLQRYRNQICCFNDDVQGTGAMGLAGVFSALRMTKTRLADQRILFVGAGEACLGIGGAVVAAMQRDGLSEAEAKRRGLFMDTKGVVVTSRGDLPEHKRSFAQDQAPRAGLLAVIEDFKPTVLIGACGQSGMFTQPVLEAMARLNDRPIVFALSNPTSKAECTAEQAYTWTGGRAVFASGSPFDPVSVGGRVHTPGQANNSYVFPGVGLGLLVSGAARATDAMFFAAADALVGQTSEADLQQGRVFPPATRMRDVALAVSVAVAAVAYEQGLAGNPRPPDLRAAVLRSMYSPKYA